MELIELVCTTCGGQVSADSGAKIGKCRNCGNSFLVKHAEELAKVEVDRTKDIAIYRSSLSEAVQINDIRNIGEYSAKLKDIIPNDMPANYFYAYSQKKQNKPDYMTAFLQNPTDGTAEEKQTVLVHLIKSSDLRDRFLVESFIRALDDIDTRFYLDSYATEFRLKKQIEENYDVIPRDVFVCHRSTNRQIAEKAVECLEHDGNRCWISYRNLRPNDSENYWQNIEDAIKHCKIFLVISSEDAMLSGDVKSEIRIAKELGKPRIEFKIDQVPHTSMFKDFFDGCKWIPAYADVNTAYQQLIQRVFEESTALKNSSKKANDIDEIKEILKTQAQSVNVPPIVQSASGSNIEQLVTNADTQFKLGNMEKAESIYNQIIDLNAKDYRGWWGIARIISKDFSDPDCDFVAFEKKYDEATAVASDTQKAAILVDCETLAKKLSTEITDTYLARNDFDKVNGSIELWKRHVKFLGTALHDKIANSLYKHIIKLQRESKYSEISRSLETLRKFGYPIKERWYVGACINAMAGLTNNYTSAYCNLSYFNHFFRCGMQYADESEKLTLQLNNTITIDNVYNEIDTKINDYETSKKLLDQLAKFGMTDFRQDIFLARLVTKDFTDETKMSKEVTNLMEKAASNAPSNNKTLVMWQKKYSDYCVKVKKSEKRVVITCSIAFFTVAVIVFLAIAIPVSSYYKNRHSLFSGGKGTETEPYAISNAEQFKLILKYNSLHFVLLNDIDVNDEWVPKKKSSMYYSDISFKGSLDGKGFAVKNVELGGYEDGLRYSSVYDSYGPANRRVAGGLFYSIKKGAEVKNIQLVNFTVAKEERFRIVAPLALYNYGYIYNVTTLVDFNLYSMTWSLDVGGLVYSNKSKIENCYTSGIIRKNPKTSVVEIAKNEGGTTVNCDTSISINPLP